MEVCAPLRWPERVMHAAASQGYPAKGMFEAFSARALLRLVWMKYLTTRYTCPRTEPAA